MTGGAFLPFSGSIYFRSLWKNQPSLLPHLALHITSDVSPANPPRSARRSYSHHSGICMRHLLQNLDPSVGFWSA